jgi:chromosome segregation ATPase
VIAAGIAAVLPFPARADIYTCVDAKGRRLTSDRPILECIDREQTQLSPSGQVLRRIGPSLTAEERAAEEEKARRAAEERKRLAEEKKRDQALLARYPDKAAHDKERAAALAAVDEVIQSANKRFEELQADRRKLDEELEFYKGDLAKAPAPLKRKFDENDQLVAAQKRFIANHEEEKKRVNARYDDELVRLRALWATKPAPAAASTAKK